MSVAYENGGLGYGFIGVGGSVCTFGRGSVSSNGCESRLHSHCMLVRLSSREVLTSMGKEKKCFVKHDNAKVSFLANRCWFRVYFRVWHCGIIIQ